MLIVLEKAEFAKCEKCKSINKVPTGEDNLNDFMSNNENNLNMKVPFMVNTINFINLFKFILINCPFCHTENRVRKDSDIVVCFICYNSFSVFKEETYQHNNSNFVSNSQIDSQIQYNLEFRNISNNLNNMIGNYINESNRLIN